MENGMMQQRAVSTSNLKQFCNAGSHLQYLFSHFEVQG